MRIASKLMALSAALLPVAAIAQDPVRVEVTTPAQPTTTTVWYYDPFWLGLGAVVLLIIVVLAIMASKSERKTTTTVIR